MFNKVKFGFIETSTEKRTTKIIKLQLLKRTNNLELYFEIGRYILKILLHRQCKLSLGSL